MSDDLVERVARAIAVEVRTVTESDVRAFELTREEYAALALAAIAVALEEAAKMAESFTTPPIASDFGTVIVDQGGEIAAAIRAMIPQENK